MRSGLLRRLCGGCNSNAGRPFRQRNDLPVDDDLLDLLQPLFVEGQNCVAHELLLFQLPDHVAIIARWPVVLLGDLQRNGFHLALNLGEGLVRHGGDLIWRDVDAVIFKRERILLRRQTKIGTSPGQHSCADPCVIIRQLGFQFSEGLLPVGQVVLLHKRRNSIDVVGVARHLSLNLNPRGIDNARLRHLLRNTLL